MRKRSAGLIFLLSLISLGIAGAEPQTEVLLLPFDIQADTDPGYLRSEIDGIISTVLQQNSAVILRAGDSSGPPADLGQEERLALVRDLGRQAGAAYVVWGKGAFTGGQYDFQAEVLDMAGTGPAAVLSEKGTGPENLLASAQALARNIALTVFKQERIADLIISGNNRIEDDAIKKRINTKAGDLFLPQNLTNDMKRVYGMGYFEDIRIEYDNSPGGKIVVFHVVEKPTIRKIDFEGNEEYSAEELQENIDIRTGSVFNTFKIKQEVNKIKALYKDKNFHNAVVSYEVEELENNQSDLIITIEEGEEAKIQKISFEGNHAFTSEEIQNLKANEGGVWDYPPFEWFTESSELGEMNTTEEGLFSFITDSGELNMEKLNQDTARIEAFYHNNGYIDARVAEPVIRYKGDAISIKFKIEEGILYRIGKVDLEGDLLRSKNLLLRRVKARTGSPVSRDALRKDVLSLTDIYANKGFFYADIYPRIDRNPEKRTADIAFVIKKGKPVYFEKILITGNTSTRDKVIRRELPIYEQELYNGERLKRGVRNLHRLDFFEDIKVDTLKGSADDKMILKIGVKDKATGAFSFGGGYSSLENLFVTASITERNLFGRSQMLRLNGEVGGRTTQIDMSFTEPWLFDIPLSASTSIYNVERDYDTYVKKSRGGGQGFGYPVFDYTRLSVAYGYEQNDYSELTTDASAYVIEGEFIMSKVTTMLQYDSRDSALNPTEGSEHSLTVTYAGGLFGGDYAFTQYIAETGWYYPLFWGTTGFLHGEGGYVRENGDGILTEEYRFALGGINSLRGFKWRDVSPKDEYGIPYGGDKYVLFNVEYIFPLFKKAGLNGVLFVDVGNAFDDHERVDLGNLRKSAGGGFRWNSPLGPIRIEYGKILDPKEGEGTGRWEFTMGTAF
ncbi:MAG: outer membrane protein assembly factor BamA [Thermodesulfobacteriota bacterium]